MKAVWPFKTLGNSQRNSITSLHLNLHRHQCENRKSRTIAEDADGELPQNAEHYNLDKSMRCESQLRTDPAAAPCTDAATVDAALVT